MQLQLEQLIPIPLEEKILHSASSVWNQAVAVSPGEYVFIQAPSGTGKTTLIHYLYGLRSDYKGSMKWDGRLVKSADPQQLSAWRSRKISIIFQDMRLFTQLTTWENLEIKRVLTNSVSQNSVEDWMQRLGIGYKKEALASTLSYGEQQRVAIIRALLQPFQWLLMDEPFSHLDRVNTRKAVELISEVVTANNAGLVLADLEDNDYFPYTRKMLL